MADRARNIYYDHWVERFEFYNRLPYAPIDADWVQLDRLLTKSGKLSERMTLEVWQRGVENYFKSGLGVHSLKHLCSQFVAFWKQPLDRFSRPTEKASQVGGGPGPQFASWHQAFLHAAFKSTQGKPGVFDAIDELFGQVADGLSEVEAYRRLKEIEGTKEGVVPCPAHREKT